MQTAVSRGIPRRQLIRRHILRNATVPITTVRGITIASLIAVAAVVEVALAWDPGSAPTWSPPPRTRIFTVVQGISLVLVATFVVINLVVDVLYAVLDPRVALGSRA